MLRGDAWLAAASQRAAADTRYRRAARLSRPNQSPARRHPRQDTRQRPKERDDSRLGGRAHRGIVFQQRQRVRRALRRRHCARCEPSRRGGVAGAVDREASARIATRPHTAQARASGPSGASSPTASPGRRPPAGFGRRRAARARRQPILRPGSSAGRARPCCHADASRCRCRRPCSAASSCCWAKPVPKRARVFTSPCFNKQNVTACSKARKMEGCRS